MVDIEDVVDAHSTTAPGRHSELPLSQAARDRLRTQARREQDLAARVAAAEARLAAERRRRHDTLASLDSAIARRSDQVADALIAYIDSAGVGLERAAMILGRSKAELAKTVRDRRATLRAQARADGHT
jgi:hypothetical protein